MEKNKYIILGNGFSIDIINRLDKQDAIDLQNLFAKGSEVKYPKTDEKGFLSAKYCPNLWSLGVNTTISREKANEALNNIITCANVLNLSKKKDSKIPTETSIFIKAYFELTSYFRYLFIHYNDLISDEDLKKIADKLPLIEYIKKSIYQGYKVKIITYNYDILLERLLICNELKYSINAFENKDLDIEIFKPHGSISFSFKSKVTKSAPYKIPENGDDIEQEADQFELKYLFTNDIPIVNALIPPAGDSERTSHTWVDTIRRNIKTELDKSCDSDELIIMGVSYWHVDRNEIDDILTSVDWNISTKYINPYPSTELNAVLSSIFKNYIHHTNSENII